MTDFFIRPIIRLSPMKSPYLQLLKQGFSEISLYSLDFLLSSLQSIAMVGTPIFIWLYILPSVDAQTFGQKISYLFIANGIAMLSGSTRLRLGKDLANKIKDGSLSRYLLRPLSPLFQILAVHLGARANELIIGFLAIIIGLFTAQILEPIRIAYFAILLVAAIIIATSYNIILGSISLWLEDADGIMYGTLQISRMLNGTSIPLTLFRATLGSLAGSAIIVLPFAGMAFTPAHILTVSSLGSEQWLFIASAIIWAILLPIFAVIIWRRGITRYEGVGA